MLSDKGLLMIDSYRTAPADYRMRQNMSLFSPVFRRSLRTTAETKERGVHRHGRAKSLEIKATKGAKARRAAVILA